MSTRPSGAGLTAREAAASDADLLLGWRNDPVTRSWSRDTVPVDPARHRSWLVAVLAVPDRMLLVVERAGEPVGTVRLDRDAAGEWEVSITVAPEHRGRGLAGPVLAVGEVELTRRTGGVTLLASVHPGNRASVALFRRSGYTRRTPTGDGLLRFAKPLAATPPKTPAPRRSPGPHRTP